MMTVRRFAGKIRAVRRVLSHPWRRSVQHVPIPEFIHMPWTLAQPAAVLPLRRIGLPLSGLVVGSMAPDFGYYVGRFDLASFAHTPTGIVAACVPASLIVMWLLLRSRHLLTAALPQPHRAALDSIPSPDMRTLRSIVLMGVAALLGATTHVIWDGFTHATGMAVHAIDALRITAGTVMGRTLHVYNILQHASTLVGLAVLAVAYRRWLARRSGAARSAPAAWLPLVGIAAAALASGGLIVVMTAPPAATVSHLVVRSVMAASTAFVLAYIVLAAWIVRRERS